MPELPEVETVVRTLEKQIKAKKNFAVIRTIIRITNIERRQL